MTGTDRVAGRHDADRHPIEAFLADLALLDGLSDDDIDRLAHLGRLRTFDPDDRIFDMDAPADTFHLVRSGLVAVEIDTATNGPLVIETVGPGDVLGVSWLLPPYRWVFGARAVEPTETVAIDAAAVRDLCDADPRLGHQLHHRFAGVIHHRLVAARMRVLDLYGPRS